MRTLLRHLTFLICFFHICLFCSAAQAGASRDFENSNAADYLDRGDDFYSDDFSLTAWVKPESINTGSVTNVWVKRNTPGVTSASNEWALIQDSANSTMRFQGYDSVSTVFNSSFNNNAISAGVWAHVAGTTTGNGGTETTYLNGVSQVTATPSNAIQNTTSRIQIGARSSNLDARWYDGLIAQAMSSNNALTAVEVVDSMWEPDIVTNGRQHYFPIFGDSPDVDLSGNGRTATVNGTVVSADGPPVFMGEGLPL